MCVCVSVWLYVCVFVCLCVFLGYFWATFGVLLGYFGGIFVVFFCTLQYICGLVVSANTVSRVVRGVPSDFESDGGSAAKCSSTNGVVVMIVGG